MTFNQDWEMELHVQLDKSNHKTTSKGAHCNIGLPFSEASKNLGINYADAGIWIFVLRLTGTSQEENNGCFVLIGNTPRGNAGLHALCQFLLFALLVLTSSLSSWQTNEHVCRFSSLLETNSKCLVRKINYSEAPVPKVTS